MLENAHNSLNHFMNEEVRIATELLEGRLCSDIEISANGKFNRYTDNVTEFVWKGKVAIVFSPCVTPQGVEIMAEHMYDNHEQVTLTDRNDV